MSATLMLVLLLACPLVGALCAIHGQYTRAWQVLFGAVVGAAIGDVILRVGSRYVTPSMMSADGARVIIWPAEISWSDRLISNVVLLTIALIVGGFVLLVRRFASPPN